VSYCTGLGSNRVILAVIGDSKGSNDAAVAARFWRAAWELCMRALDYIGAMVVAFVLAIGIYNVVLWLIRKNANRNLWRR
jgi:hypothetical protein